jgi:ferredoxin-type protein NapH
VSFSRARRITLSLVVALVIVGLIFHTGTGTLSSFGWREIASICPVGIIEVFLAEKTLIPRVLVVLVLIAGAAFLLGKVFCSWLCPVPPLRRLFAFSGKKQTPKKAEAIADKSEVSQDESVPAAIPDALAPAHTSDCSSGCSSCAEKRAKLDSRHVVLGGALLSSAIFGFPVFCIVCPVGLSFATIIALWRWIGFDELTLSLLVFPAILLIELLVLRKWCHRFCPLGAVFSLMSIPNRFFKPKVDQSVCLQSKGIECGICSEVCEEKLDPHFADGMHECSKCGECIDHCPTRAITLPFKGTK